MTLSDLPAINALLNGLSAVFLLIGFYYIRRGNIEAHRRFMIAAFVTSALFLVAYLTYHYQVSFVTKRGPTVFRDPAWFRPYYLAILLSHTILAAAVLPMALITFWRGLKNRVESHRKIARWTLPLWIYVSATGVLIYFLLYQIFQQT
jgi:putative membrane protein